MSQDKEPRMHTCHHPHAEKRGKKKGTRGASHRHSTRGNHGSPGTKDDSLSLLSLEDGKEPESGRMPFSSAEKPRKRSSKRIPEEDDLKDSDRERAHPSRAKSMASQRKRSIAPSTSVASSARAPRRVVPAVPGGGGTKSRKGSRFRPPRASKASIADSSPLSSRFIEGGGITVLHSAVASPDASAVPMQLSPGTSHYTFVVSPTKRIPYSAHKDGSSPTNHLLSTSTRIRIPMSNSKGVVPTPAGSDLSQASILQLPCSSSVRSDQPSSTFREYRSSITVGGAGGGVVVSSSSPRDYTPEIREKAGVYTVVEGARWLSDMYKKEPMYSKKTGNSLDELGSIELLAPHRKRKHKAHRIPSPLFSGSREADEGIPLPQRFHRESPALRSISEGRRGRSDGRNSSVHSDFVTPISRRDAQKRASRVRPATP